MKKWMFILLVPVLSFIQPDEVNCWIRINQLGYTPGGNKNAVWAGKTTGVPDKWMLVDAKTEAVVYSGTTGKLFGSYGPFSQTFRINFSNFKRPGRYYLKAGQARSPVFEIGDNVYKGTADFCLRYMRQQRSGFNPFLKDSCHTRDGYVLYGNKAGIKDSSYINVSGGWHDASDYLQYATTSANATYHLLMAYRDFPGVFTDSMQQNGLAGSNGRADVLDEAQWGLDWLLKMHPSEKWMFNQIADDRDHMGMRIPKEDTFYGKGIQRPVYFVSGEPQQRGKFMNNSTGTSSTAGKFSSAFSLGAKIFQGRDGHYATLLASRARSAYAFGLSKPGVMQTASVRSPYIYAEDNWTDDMELAAAGIYAMQREKNEVQWKKTWGSAIAFSKMERITPWLGNDTARHYQWYPFINPGHYELAKLASGNEKDTLIGYYRQGIERVWKRASANAFYYGIPYIWCSNNLAVSFAIQCYWYRALTGDQTFSELEQANFDWLFGCNPWGTGMVYNLPLWGDVPVDPHSAFTHIGNYPIDGGLVDGPVYGSIYKNLIGIQLKDLDEYASFQSDLAVYHDDYGDYSTNEPTMDGTASLIYLLAAKESEAIHSRSHFSYSYGAIARGDSTSKQIALVFTADEFAEGGDFVRNELKRSGVKASFFFTGRFYQQQAFKKLVQGLRNDGHYLGPHSNGHLLYCDWAHRDSLLVSKKEFADDLNENLATMKKEGIKDFTGRFFIPPYEWYNDTIAAWTREMGLTLVNYTPGTKSTADYTYPGLTNYRSSDEIYQSVIEREQGTPSGLNGFILLSHIGTDPKRTDKFYRRLPALMRYLKGKGYQFRRIDELLKID